MLLNKLLMSGGRSPEFSLVHTAQNLAIFDTTTTFSSCALGDADENRQIWVSVSTLSQGEGVNLVCTVGGISATRVAEYPASSTRVVAIFHANVPTGTTGNIVIDNLTGEADDFTTVSIAAYRLLNYATTPDDSVTWNVYSNDITLTAAANQSAVLAVIVSNANITAPQYTGLTRDYKPEGDTSDTFAHYSATNQAAGSNTYTRTGGVLATFAGYALVLQPDI